MDAKEDLDLIDQYLRNQLNGEALIQFEEKLQKDYKFLQKVELQRKTIQAIKRVEIRNILRKTHYDISEEKKSKLQKLFEIKRFRNRYQYRHELKAENPIKELTQEEDSESWVSIYEIVKGVEGLNYKDFNIKYEGDPNPPFRVAVHNAKVKFPLVKIYSPFKGYNFHYHVSLASGYTVRLSLIGDFDPNKLTLVYYKEYNWWSIKLRIDNKEYKLDEIYKVTTLSE